MKDAFAKPPGWVDPTPIGIMQAARVGDEVTGAGGSRMLVARNQDGMVVLTDDGVVANTAEWHRVEVDGPEAGIVYVERWSSVGREFHGWIDGESRKLVQAG
jgi:hypothetical protein